MNDYITIEHIESTINALIDSSIHSIELRYGELLIDESLNGIEPYELQSDIVSHVTRSCFQTVVVELSNHVNLEEFVNISYMLLQDEFETEYMFDYCPVHVTHVLGSGTYNEKFNFLVKYFYSKILLGTNWDKASTTNNSNVTVVDFRK